MATRRPVDQMHQAGPRSLVEDHQMPIREGHFLHHFAKILINIGTLGRILQDPSTDDAVCADSLFVGYPLRNAGRVEEPKSVGCPRDRAKAQSESI